MKQGIKEQIELIRRGVVDLTSEEELEKKLGRSLESGRPLRVKLGIDPTAPDIHLGFTVVLRKMKAFQDLGHQPVLILGDYTARIGDPSGRNKTRPQLSGDDVDRHAATYLEQVSKILDLDRVEVVRNGTWFGAMSFLEVIHLSARSTVARLLERDDFQKRYRDGVPISLHEFIYPLMQAYDSVQVKADVELGGTDQTFNLLLGRTLQKEEGQEPQVCITTPILPGTDGVKKMSKSLGNYIGVSESPQEMFGKCMSIPDALLSDYYLLLTSEAEEEYRTKISDHPMQAKMDLATRILLDYHGEAGARLGKEHFEKVFQKRETPDEMPRIEIDRSQVEDGKIWIVSLLRQANFATSGGEARRVISQGGVRVDDQRIEDPNAWIEIRDGAVLRVGKRRFARIEWTA
ncbi:MAG: tyrosine--tRNA ligase [Planctomycetota bacterium]|jgi:tyrosyl-tRNA synthetase|nr:tyrosine--tRNA ligase [Planctomycetota bacterium]